MDKNKLETWTAKPILLEMVYLSKKNWKRTASSFHSLNIAASC